MGSIVKGVDFVTVPTQDIERAIAFYRDVLELEAGPTWGGGDGTPPIGAEFETGTVTLALLDAAAVGQEFSPHKVPVAFHVDDVEAAKATLQGRGVTFLGDTIDSGVCHQAIFLDPDGNALDLHHRYAPR